MRVGLVDGQFVANPTTAEQEASQLELVVAGTEDAVLMVEAGAKEVSEDKMLEAIAFGHEQCRRLARMQKELMAQAAKPRWAFDAARRQGSGAGRRVRELASAKLAAALATHEKHARAEAVSRVFDDVWAGLGLDDGQERRGARRVRGSRRAPRCAA